MNEVNPNKNLPLNKKRWIQICVLLLIGFLYTFCLPDPLFHNTYCQVLFDKDNQLLGASIAKDGQWRFPLQEKLPSKFEASILEFEDKRFYHHPGFDVHGIFRALVQNVKNGKVVSGASTLSMQVIRLSRPGKTRSFYRKLIEMVQASRLELKHSKKEILALYSAHAPFGGNVVGLEAASWRYFAKAPDLLSWAEAACLAVLPNSPSLIHPGRNRKALLHKRNRLLKRLYEKGQLDKLTYELALEETIPEKPIPLPRLAPHLLHSAFEKSTQKNAAMYTSIDQTMQNSTDKVIKRHAERLAGKGIHNAAALIVHVPTSKIRTYIGNNTKAGIDNQQDVDVIKAPRSTGSILKPILNMLVLQEGVYLPNSMIQDVPTNLKDYSPQNYKYTYDGVIPLSEALQRSLNVPYVNILQKYGLEKFHFKLQELGFSNLNPNAKHYGLPLILGGAEASLWDLCQVYLGASKTLGNWYKRNSKYAYNDFKNMSYLKENGKAQEDLEDEPSHLHAGAIWHTFDAMRKLERPDSEGNWESFNSSQRIAWKTGTSFGFRDAWSIGITKDYVVGVWVGNADGEGRPGLIGVETAAPILFDIFRMLPKSDWFDIPYDDMTQVLVCDKSGMKAKEGICKIDTSWCPLLSFNSPLCKYHKEIFLDKEKNFQVNSNCENPLNTRKESWFILNPIEEHYYKKRHPDYKSPPLFRNDCKEEDNENGAIQFIYPSVAKKIYVPIELDGQPGKTIFKVAHRREEETIQWHLDNTYLGSTSQFHSMELNPSQGKHRITLVDESGYILTREFEILSEQ